jgi:hypothetical protein
MKLGLGIVATSWEGGAAKLSPTLVEIVEAAEAAGFDLISVSDQASGKQRIPLAKSASGASGQGSAGRKVTAHLA